MPESSDIHLSGASSSNSVWVMVLPTPPAPWKISEWYGKQIAGVPLVLRNIFNLQQAGINHLVIFNSDVGALKELLRRISGESRVKLNLESMSDTKHLVRENGNRRRIVLLNGSALVQKNEIESALGSASNNTSSASDTLMFMDFKSIEPVLEKMAQNLSHPVEDVLKQTTRQTDDPEKNHRRFLLLAGDEGSMIRQEEDFKHRHEDLLKTCGLSNDSFMDRLCTRFISRQLTRFFLKTPLTPNQITFLSLGLGLSSAWCFLNGTFGMGLAGAALLLLSAWIDCTDGEIARLKFLESKFGRQLDIISDNIVHLAVFFCIGMGLYFSSGNRVFILFGGLAALGTLISFFTLGASIIEKKTRASSQTGAKPVPKGLVDQLANRDFTYFLFVMAVLGRLDIFIALTGVGANVFAAYLLYSRFKPSSANLKKT